MPQRCNTCDHPQRYEVEQLLVGSRTSYQSIADQYGLSKDALRRHVKSGHLTKALVDGHARAEKVTLMRIENHIENMIDDADLIMAEGIKKPGETSWVSGARVKLEAFKLAKDFATAGDNGQPKKKNETGAEDYIREIGQWPRYLEYLKFHAEPASI